MGWSTRRRAPLENEGLGRHQPTSRRRRDARPAREVGSDTLYPF